MSAAILPLGTAHFQPFLVLTLATRWRFIAVSYCLAYTKQNAELVPGISKRQFSVFHLASVSVFSVFFF